MIELVAVIWVLLSIVAGYAALSRGRSRWIWSLIALILSPVIAVLILIALPPAFTATIAPTPTHAARGRLIGGAVLVGLIVLAIAAAQFT